MKDSKKFTLTNVLLTALLGVMAWIGVQTQRSYDKVDDAVFISYEAKLEMVTATNDLEIMVKSTREEIVDSLDVLKKEIVTMLGKQQDSIDDVRNGVLIPLVRTVQRHEGRIDVLEAKERARTKKEKEKDLCSFDKSGIK